MWNKLLYEWDWYRRPRRWVCRVVGHNMHSNYSAGYAEDRCNRCFYSDREICLDELTFPKLLNKIYVWVVEHNLGLFSKFDVWLINSRYRGCLPGWWEY